MNKFEINIDIRFGDIDMLGHVNNAKYITYLEHVRMKFSNRILPDINWEKEGFILARTEMDYVQPVYLNEDLKVTCWCSKIGSKSFVLSYEIIVIRSNHEIIAAKAKTILVAFDYENGKSKAIPESWKDKLSKYLMENKVVD